jgi:hypothetical protein
MLDVKTPLSKVFRASRRINDTSTFSAKPGQWGYVDTANNICKVAATSAQKKVLKLIMGNCSTNTYESNDVKVGSISTLEGMVRATVDSDGYAVSGGTAATVALTYAQGDDLTVVYTAANAGFTNAFATIATTDFGKLSIATVGDMVVAQVENIDTTLGQLTFQTITPRVKA